LVSINQSDTTYDPGFLDYTKKYYWKIVAKDSQENVTEGDIWDFTTGVPSPDNLLLTADAEGDGVIFSWNSVYGVDGYDIVTPDGDSIFLDYTVTSYHDDFPSTTGTYKVYSVFSGARSDPATISSSPYVSTSNITVYGWMETGPSGFGWNTTTGICQAYSCAGGAGNEGVIDFYFYDQSGYYHFISGDEPPYNGNKTSHILRTGTSNFF